MVAAAALHVAWGRGSSFPAPDRAALAEAVVGVRPGAAAARGPRGRAAPGAEAAPEAALGVPRGDNGERPPSVPGPAACYAVAALLAAGAVGLNLRGPIRRRTGLVVVIVLAARGGAGLAGLLPQDASPTFRRWNRRLYSPWCLVLAALASPAIVSG